MTPNHLRLVHPAPPANPKVEAQRLQGALERMTKALAEYTASRRSRAEESDAQP